MDQLQSVAMLVNEIRQILNEYAWADRLGRIF